MNINQLSVKLLALVQRTPNGRLLLLFSLATLLLVELIVSCMSLLLTGHIAIDFLLTGLVATSLVAPPLHYLIIRLFKELLHNKLVLEQREKLSDQRLAITITNAQILVWELDLLSGKLRFDDEQFKLLGIVTDRPPLTLDDWLHYIHPDDLASFKTQFELAMQPGDALFDLEYRHRQQPGIWGWCHSKGQVIQRDARGTPLLAVGSTMNITASKQAEQESLDSNRRFEMIFNNNPDVMVISRLPEGIITNVNEAFVIRTGYARDEAIGNTTTALNFWTAEKRQVMTQALTEKGYCQNLEFEFLMKNGEKRYGSFSSVITQLQGAPHTVSTIHDITTRKQQELALLASEEHASNLASMLRLMCDNVPDMIWAKDLNQRYIFSNKALCEQLLGSKDTQEPLGRDDMFFALRNRSQKPDDNQWFTFGELCQDSDRITWENGHAMQFYEFGNIRGQFTILDVHKAPFINDDGEVIGVVGSARNVTEQKAAEDKLRLAALVLENSSEAMYVMDADNRIVDINPAFTQLTGYSLEEVFGQDAAMLHSERHSTDFYQAKREEIQRTGHWQGEVWNRQKDGGIIAEWITINTIYHEDGSVHRRVALFSDITERKKSEELIWAQANFDQLTQLPNRRMFRDRLAQDLKKAHRTGQKLALLFLDLDHFKEVNDTLGHDLGDQLLIETARRISACIREYDTVARLGGDEFTLILTDLEEVSHIEHISENIITQLCQPFDLNGEKAYVSASIGITLYPDDADNIEDLLKNADQAMFVSKRAGRNRFSFFTNAMQETALYRMHLINDLRTALQEEQFELYYQPIIALPSQALHKAEALIRWSHPTRGSISPAEFIPLAEESGLINEIGDWVFSQSARQLSRWKRVYLQPIQLSINISPIQIQATQQFPHWLEKIERAGLSGKDFVFEITEGLLLDNASGVTARLLAFRDAGIQVAIDDFGTGYSSLSYLNKLDIDYLKIDQSFTRNLARESSELALCEAIVVMAHKLGLKVIAEGVETAEQHRLLSAIGCDFGQGYYYSQPLPIASFEAFVTAQQAAHPLIQTTK